MTDTIVPPVIAKFLNLKRLILRDSRFTGEIPAFIGTLTKLEAL